MSTPFSWSSRSTKINTKFKRNISQTLQDSLDAVFQGTLKPKLNQKAWFEYLFKQNVASVFGVIKPADLSLMLPPIEDVNLPLLEKLRESLSDINDDAVSYPYSSRSCQDIKNLIILYKNVNAKDIRLQNDLTALGTQIQIEQANKKSLKKRLSTSSSSSIDYRKRNLAKLSTSLGIIRRLKKKQNQLKSNKDNGNKYKKILRNKIEEILFATPKWKYKDEEGNPITTPVPNGIEKIAKTQRISHLSIYEAIQEEISKLESDNIDIHPIPWKNLLIIPRGIKGLPPNWDSPSMERIGYATNKVKYQANGMSAALVGTWEQFATFGTEGFSNKLQKALSNSVHKVKLNAKVEINFNKDGQIQPSVPWWNNENSNKIPGLGDIGEHPVNSHTKNGFVSQVGFAWQYKIPQHSRATLSNTPWELALDSNGDPYKHFNLPKGTCLYAVRLAFIKADGSVEPLSNVITGSDVHSFMRSKLNMDMGKFDIYDNEPLKKRTINDSSKYNQVSKADVKRLTKKARALLNITSSVKNEELEKLLTMYNNILKNQEANLNRKLAELKVLKDIETTVQQIQVVQYSLEKQANRNARPVSQRGKQKRELDANLARLTTVTDITNWFNNPGLTSNQLEQAYLYEKFVLRPKIDIDLKQRDMLRNKFYETGDKIQNLEYEKISWLANGHVDNNSTEHCPGLISKERAISQAISFTQTIWPLKKEREEAANNTAGTVIYTKPGRWLAYEQDLPEEACLMMEPWLKTYKKQHLMDMLKSNQLRASNYDSSRALADVTSDTLESFSTWLNSQKKNTTEFAEINSGRQLLPAEQLISEFEDLNKSIPVSNLLNVQFKSRAARVERERQEIKERLRKKQEALQKEREKAEQERRNFAKAQEQEKILKANTVVKGIATEVENIKTKLKKAQTEFDSIEESIKKRKNNIDALATRRKLNKDENTKLKALLNNQADEKNKLIDLETIINQIKVKLQLEEANYKRVTDDTIEAKRTSLNNNIQQIKVQLDSLEIESKKELNNLDEKEKTDKLDLQRKIERLEQQMQTQKRNLKETIIQGNIQINENNQRIFKNSTDENELAAPADIRFGGGYFWKESDELNTVPYGSYLIYEENKSLGDRLKRVWSSILPDNKLENDDDMEKTLTLYDTLTMNEENVKHRNIQPVLSDNIKVKKTAPGVLEKTDDLIRLFKASGSTTRNQSLSYLALRNTGQADSNGSDLEYKSCIFYDTLLKPGTFVHFILEKERDDEAELRTQRQKIRNRLRKFPDNWEIDMDGSTPVIDLDDGAVLSGKIVTIRIANSANTVPVDDIKTKKDKLTTLQLNPLTLARDIREKEEELKTLIDNQGSFVFKNKSAGNLGYYDAIVVADIEVIKGVIIKNIPYVDICEVSMVPANNSSSFVIGKIENEKINGSLSVHNMRADGLCSVITPTNVYENIKKESLMPRFKKNTKVIYVHPNGNLRLGVIQNYNEGDFVIPELKLA